jgi:hypothetical protein
MLKQLTGAGDSSELARHAISKDQPWLVSVEAKRFSAHCLSMASLVSKEYDFGS